MNDHVLEINNYSSSMMAYKLYIDAHQSYTNRIIHIFILTINTLSLFTILNVVPMIPGSIVTMHCGFMLMVLMIKEYTLIPKQLFNQVAPMTITLWMVSKCIHVVFNNWLLIIVLLTPLWLYTSNLLFEYRPCCGDVGDMLFEMIIHGPLFVYLETRRLMGIEYDLNEDFYVLDKKDV